MAIIGLFERGQILLVIWLSGSFRIYITVKISPVDRIQSVCYVTDSKPVRWLESEIYILPVGDGKVEDGRWQAQLCHQYPGAVSIIQGRAVECVFLLALFVCLSVRYAARYGVDTPGAPFSGMGIHIQIDCSNIVTSDRTVHSSRVDARTKGAPLCQMLCTGLKPAPQQ